MSSMYPGVCQRAPEAVKPPKAENVTGYRFERVGSALESVVTVDQAKSEVLIERLNQGCR